jgi:hypothetical protein
MVQENKKSGHCRKDPLFPVFHAEYILPSIIDLGFDSLISPLLSIEIKITPLLASKFLANFNLGYIMLSQSE